MAGIYIDITNYEAYLLDYAEGTLGEAESQALMAFVEAHPELEIDLGELQDMVLLHDEAVFEHKQNLKRSEKDLVSDEQFVAYIEGQLSTEETQFVEKSVANNAFLQKELALFKKTVLVPEELNYADKESLKRRNKIVWLNPQYMRFAAAAAVLVALVMGFLYYNNTGGTQNLANNASADSAHAQPLKPQQQAQVAESNTNQPAVTATSNASQEKAQPVTNARKEQAPQMASANKPEQEKNQAKNPQNKVPNQPQLNPTPANSNGSMLANNTATASVRKEQKITNVPLPEKQLNEKEQILVASADPMDSKVITMTDDEAEAKAGTARQTGFWAKAGKALSRLNRAGVKTVDGKEKDKQESTDYVLTLGNVHIRHSQAMR